MWVHTVVERAGVNSTITLNFFPPAASGVSRLHQTRDLVSMQGEK